MNDYTERQVADLLELMPELMMHLRNRAEAGDNGARSLFDSLDIYCWHQPETCGVGMTCEGGKRQRHHSEQLAASIIDASAPRWIK